MTRLLVSVRDCDEAQIALEEGVDLIDIKEPSRGSLGHAEPTTIRAIAERVAGRVPLSAALGELSERFALPVPLARRLRYVKFGLSGIADTPDWQAQWQQAIERLPPGVTAVAVAYADASAAQAPEAASILASAPRVGCGAFLIDTFNKQAGSLFSHLSAHELTRLIDNAKRDGLTCVVAGGLGIDEMRMVLPLAPDYVAVRGAACTQDRTGRVDRRRVRALLRLLRPSAGNDKLQRQFRAPC